MVYGYQGNRSLGLVVNDFLGMFNIKGGGIGAAIDGMTGNSIGQLENMRDMALETALGTGTGPIQRTLGQMAIPPSLLMPSPMSAYPAMMPLCGCGYAGGTQQIDLAAGSTNFLGISALLDPRRRMAGQFERQLRNNPYARAAFESQIGGRIVDFGIRNDGKFTVQRFAPGWAPMAGTAFNPMANTAFGYLASMQSAAGFGGAFAGGNFAANPFMGYLAGGFGNLLGTGGFGGGFGTGAGIQGMGPLFANPAVMTWPGLSQTIGLGSPNQLNVAGLQNSLGGEGLGSLNPQAAPGQIQNTNVAYERAHQAEIDAVLRDPSLTVEDKVTLMIMLIMKKMDQDIERQAQYINSIQQQQSNRGQTSQTGGQQPNGKGKGAVGGQAGGLDNQSSPSIDVETMKLKRMIDKRSQMFDMLRQIIDKYNQTAKGIIDSIAR